MLVLQAQKLSYQYIFQILLECVEAQQLKYIPHSFILEAHKLRFMYTAYPKSTDTKICSLMLGPQVDKLNEIYL